MRSTSFCMCTSRFSSLQKLLNTWVAFISFSLCTALQSMQQGCRSCFYELFPLESAQRSAKPHPHFIFKFWWTFVHFFANVTVNSTHPSTVCKDHFTPLPHPFFFICLYSFFFNQSHSNWIEKIHQICIVFMDWKASGMSFSEVCLNSVSILELVCFLWIWVV